MTTEVQAALGCSKCRYSKKGCKRCRDPAFQKRQRDNGASASANQRPAKRRKASSSKSVAAAQPEGKAPPAQSTRSQARPAKDASSLPDHEEQATTAATPQDSLPVFNEQSVPKRSDTHAEHQDQVSSPPAATAAADADADDTSATLQPPSVAGSQHPAAVDPNAEAQVLSQSKSLAAAPATAVPVAGTAKSTANTAQAAAPAGPPANSQAASPQAQPTPGPAEQQDNKPAGLGSQGTASDSSRPSFLAMLQSKMDKKRQERRGSQSAGSASDSSMSSVHAAGTSSAGKAGTSVDSGTQAPQAMNAVRHKVKQQKRRSTKKAPAKTRAFLQRGPDPRQALWHPPASPYGLIEEYLYENPWKLLVACMLLNVTSGFQVRKVIWKLFDIWPTAETAAGANDDSMVIVEKLIQPLGLFRKRTIAIKRFSQEYLETDWLDPIELHGIGQYASDAYFMFCRGNWQDVEPSDKDLLKYQKWLHSTGGEGTGLERDALPEAATASKLNIDASVENEHT